MENAKNSKVRYENVNVFTPCSAELTLANYSVAVPTITTTPTSSTTHEINGATTVTLTCTSTTPGVTYQWKKANTDM